MLLRCIGFGGFARCGCRIIGALIPILQQTFLSAKRGLHFPNVDFKPVQFLAYTRDAVIIHVIFEALYLVADVLQTVHQLIV